MASIEASQPPTASVNAAAIPADIEDTRIGAFRDADSIADYFDNGAVELGVVEDGVLLPTGETLPEVQLRVLGPSLAGKPLFTETRGWWTVSLRGGYRINQSNELTFSVANIFDRNYRLHGSGFDAPGFSAPDHNHKWSLRASYTSELVLEDVRVPESAMLPGVQGLRGPLSCLTQARYGIAWGALGAAYACFDETLGYQKERIVFDKPIAEYQIPQQKFANMATDITCGHLLALRLGRLKDEGRFTPAQVSMAKRNNVALALDVSRTCRDMLGANGVTLEYQTGRHMLNLESVVTYEGTHDIHTLAIGNEVTGIPAYR